MGNGIALHLFLSMGYPSWQSRAQKIKRYSARRPEESALYRLVYYHREQLEYSWDEQFSERYGVLRDEVLNSFDRYLNCGILRHGCALACCENEQCAHSMLIAFSCKRRGICPSCQAKRAVLFAENLHENVLFSHPHRHLVFSLPKRLRIYFKFDRRFFSLLYRAAWEAWSEWVDGVLPGAKPAAVLALHTAGALLNWHPHIHGIFLNGGIFTDGSYAQLPEVDVELLEEFFAEKVFSFLLREERPRQSTIDSMKDWEHSGFNVFAGEPIGEEDENARLFLARYLKKAPLAAERLSIDESGREPVVRYVERLDAVPVEEGPRGEEHVRCFSPLEFLAAAFAKASAPLDRHYALRSLGEGGSFPAISLGCLNKPLGTSVRIAPGRVEQSAEMSGFRSCLRTTSSLWSIPPPAVHRLSPGRAA